MLLLHEWLRLRLALAGATKVALPEVEGPTIVTHRKIMIRLLQCIIYGSAISRFTQNLQLLPNTASCTVVSGSNYCYGAYSIVGALH